MPTHTELKGATSVNKALLNAQIETNLISFFEWGLLQLGAFGNVYINSSGHYGGNQSTLTLTKDPRYNNGQVWQGFRQNWVYESGIQAAAQPIIISGVYVNGTFYPSNTTGAYKHHVDYIRGRVVFDSAISQTAVVKAEYSYKYVTVVDAETPWLRQLQKNSYRLDDSHFSASASGEWAVIGENRLQLPAIIVEVESNRGFLPYQLGQGQYVNQGVNIHIIGETPFDKNQLMDIVSNQNNKTIYLYDRNVVRDSGLFPLDYRGALNSGAWNYPDLVENEAKLTYWRKLTFKDTRVVPLKAANYYGATVKTTCEIIMTEI